MTLTTAAAGADSSGQGATQVRFVTRSGTNQFQTSLYEYFRHKSLNTNTFFNQLAGLPKPQSTDNNYGGRIGGPIVHPGPVRRPRQGVLLLQSRRELVSRTRRAGRARSCRTSRLGNFTYNIDEPDDGEPAARSRRRRATRRPSDPTVVGVLAQIREFGERRGELRHRIDHDVDDRSEPRDVRLAESGARRHGIRRPARGRQPHQPASGVGLVLLAALQRRPGHAEQRRSDVPGLPGAAHHARSAPPARSGSDRRSPRISSTTCSGGWQWSPVDFFGDSTPDMFDEPGRLCAVGLGFSLTNANPGGADGPAARNTVNWNIDDNLNWLRGKHNFSFGFSFTRLDELDRQLDHGADYLARPTPRSIRRPAHGRRHEHVHDPVLPRRAPRAMARQRRCLVAISSRRPKRKRDLLN